MDSIIANIVIVVSALTLLAAAALTAYSVAHSLRVNKRPKMENGVPTRTIGIATIVMLLAVAIPTLLIGSVTDMCITTSLVLLVTAAGLVIYGRAKTLRRVRGNHPKTQR